MYDLYLTVLLHILLCMKFLIKLILLFRPLLRKNLSYKFVNVNRKCQTKFNKYIKEKVSNLYLNMIYDIQTLEAVHLFPSVRLVFHL